MKKRIIFFFAANIIFGTANVALSENIEKSYYDYSTTEIILLYSPGEDGGRMLSPPFSEFANDYGPRFNNLVLLYVKQFEDLIVPLGEPLFMADFLGSNNYKRFYFGPYWVSDGEKFAFMNESDFNQLKDIWTSRSNADPPERELGKSLVEKELGALRAEAERNGEATTLEQERESIQRAIDRANYVLEEFNKSERDELNEDLNANDDAIILKTGREDSKQIESKEIETLSESNSQAKSQVGLNNSRSRIEENSKKIDQSSCSDDKRVKSRELNYESIDSLNRFSFLNNKALTIGIIVFAAIAIYILTRRKM